MIVVLVMMNVILILPLSAQVKDKGIDSTYQNLLKVYFKQILSLDTV